MEIREIIDLIRVVAVPEPGHESFVDGLGPKATFWVHTVGLEQFGRPDLEMVGVPALWVGASVRELNEWAAYSVDHEISEGEKLEGGGPIPVLLSATKSESDYWGDHPLGALTLSTLRVGFQCGCCPETSQEIH